MIILAMLAVVILMLLSAGFIQAVHMKDYPESEYANGYAVALMCASLPLLAFLVVTALLM